MVLVWRWILRDRSRRYRRVKRHRSQFLAPAIRVLRWVCYLRQRNCVASISGGDDEGFKRLLLAGKESPTPKGYLAVYVGGGEKEDEPPQRYLVSILHFNHPLFVELLREAEKEFGFHHPHGITIPCPAWRFERIQTRIAAGCAVARQKRGCRVFSWF
ncbi:auxin-responsive protein SAUR36-like [Dendrobium catenatum]|uniref:Indole-3-acetic acid-induced protein ARG7 n=1 Tax=Dendrobium catenatum TaxID=906689 RepID=A0A2I0W7A0_9ASPA|nr:auxin-responsive protein SAUR36-like [Dendrobium catenatum]PKU71532.1 Indole-3-acetic acid-induced protein ARG7 [Dendrobium catenatum]